MKLKERLSRGAAAGVVAGTLSVAMLAGQAAPANAILPIVPVVIGAVGGTATGAAVSGWAVAGYAALTAGVLGASMAIRENGSVWFTDAMKMLAPETNPPAKVQQNESFNKDPFTGNPPAPTASSYSWGNTKIEIRNERWTKYQFAGFNRPVNAINFDFFYNSLVIQDPAIRLQWAMENQCKRESDGTIYSETRFMKQGVVQSQSGYQTMAVQNGCAAGPGGAQGYSELMSTRIRPVTEAEKRDPAKFDQSSYPYAWDTYAGAAKELVAKAPGFNYGDPGYRATVQCVSPTGVKTSLSLETAYSPEGKVGIPSCAAAGLGDVAASLSIDFIDGTHTVSPAFRTIPGSDTMLECDPAFGNYCQLEIYIDGVPCVVGTVQCAGWVSQHMADPSRVKCFYGSREVSISNCGVLEGAYIYGGSPLTQNNTDGNRDTWDDPRKVPGWSPSIDPGGEPAPETQPNPNDDPQPSTSPSPSPSPSPSSSINPEPFPPTGTNPESTPGEDGQNCLATGWSWNPVSWVMVPVQCALQWAFVPPKVRVDTAIGTIIPKLEVRGIEPFVIPVMGGVGGLGGSGCSGPPIDLSSIKLDRVLYPFSACEAPMSHIATGVYSFFALAIVIQGGMSCIRGVAAAFGFNWGLGSKEDD